MGVIQICKYDLDERGERREVNGARTAWITAFIMLAITVGLLLLGRQLVYPYPIGPKQPLPFSHRIHTQERGINCIFCHDSADRSSNAGMPTVAKCLLCHNVILTKFTPIQRLQKYYKDGEPVPWVRVNRLPDYVNFTHEMHLAAEVDCGKCHGDVTRMDRIQTVYKFTMGFCVDCHRQEEAPVGCLYCHY